MQFVLPRPHHQRPSGAHLKDTSLLKSTYRSSQLSFGDDLPTMSDPQDINGTYRIFYQGGALAGKKTNYPLTVEAPNNPDYEVWLVENLQERGHLIRQKSSPQMGLTYPSDVYPACPVLLDEQPRTVTIASVGRADHFV